MSNRTLLVGVAVLVVLAGAYFAYSNKGAVLGASDTKSLEVRWLLSHQPTEVFERAAEVFKAELEKESAGSMTLRIVYPQEIGVAKGDIPNAEVFRLLDEGAADIATAYTVALGYKTPDLWAAGLPFLFSDYAAVGAALDGALGEAMFAALPRTQGVVGLAFTMSGGYRIIASKNTSITSLKDIKGKRIATSGGPVAEATLRALGAEPVALDLEGADPSIDTTTIDGVEITYSRLKEVIGTSAYTARISETNHSVFLTAILAKGTFFEGLLPQQQVALKKAALAAAKVEREDSRALGDRVREELRASGSVITTLSADASAEAGAKARGVYGEFLKTFSAEVSALAGGTQ
jgi:TRAP-type C4-dicarboxylate transport system substrate-binding protein